MFKSFEKNKIYFNYTFFNHHLQLLLTGVEVNFFIFSVFMKVQFYLQRTALHWSAAFNNEESVRLLIKYQCNPAVSDNEGKTPLHWAANTHDPAVVPTLKTLLVSFTIILYMKVF